MFHVLQLNADYTPMKVLRWERAVELVLAGKATTVVPFAGRFVRSPSLAVPWPAVVALRRYAQIRGRVRFSARNVRARDNYTCAYCGVCPRGPDGRTDKAELTLDHVIPRAQAKHGAVYLPWVKRWTNVTCWENSVTACRACNTRKADRTPQQAQMSLLFHPRVPTQSDSLRMALGRLSGVPGEWADYLPSAWGMASRPAEVREVDEAVGR